MKMIVKACLDSNHVSIYPFTLLHIFHASLYDFTTLFHPLIHGLTTEMILFQIDT